MIGRLGRIGIVFTAAAFWAGGGPVPVQAQESYPAEASGSSAARAAGIPGATQLDLNSASLEQIKALKGMSAEDAQAIFDYRKAYDYVRSIYEIRKIPGMTAEKFEALKSQVKLVYPRTDEDQLIQSDLAAAEGRIQDRDRIAQWSYRQPVIRDVLLDRLRYPDDINKVTVDDLLTNEQLKPSEAVAIVKTRNENGDFGSMSAIRDVQGLTSWGNRNLRNKVWVYEKPKASTSPAAMGEKTTTQLAEEAAEWRLKEKREFPSFRGHYSLVYDDWHGYGWTGLNYTPHITNKLRLGYKDRVKFGVVQDRGVGDEDFFDLRTRPFGWDLPVKSYVGLEHTPITGGLELNKIYVGNYHIHVGQGLFFTNTDERYLAFADSWPGLYGDSSITEESRLFGPAAELRLKSGIGDFTAQGWYSNDTKDAILNPGGKTVNYYWLQSQYAGLDSPIIADPNPVYQFVSRHPKRGETLKVGTPLAGLGGEEARYYGLTEEVAGGQFKYSPAPDYSLGVAYAEIRTDKAFDPRPETLAGQAFWNDVYFISENRRQNGDYLDLMRTYDDFAESTATDVAKTPLARRIVGANAMYVHGRFSLLGDFARVLGPRQKLFDANDTVKDRVTGQPREVNRDAYLLTADWRFENLSLTGRYRHYALGYDNPYARPVAESQKFNDSYIKDEFRYMDHVDGVTATDPVTNQTVIQEARYSTHWNINQVGLPKAEDGVTLGTRWRFDEHWTLNSAQVDYWRQLADQSINYRAEAELQYQPVFPVQIRWRERTGTKDVFHNRSSSHESLWRVQLRLSNRDEFDTSYTANRREFGYVPDFPRFHGLFWGGTMAAFQLRHKFSKVTEMTGVFNTWQTFNYGFVTDYEAGHGVDFLNFSGHKYRVELASNLTKDLRVVTRFRNKITLVDTEPNEFTKIDPTRFPKDSAIPVFGTMERNVQMYTVQLDYFF